MSFIYLATPHNHEDSKIRDQRFEAAQLAAATVFAYQIPVYSPIAHWHPIALAHDLPHGWNYWKHQDEMMVRVCKELWVITIEGWETSKGIAAEVSLMKQLHKTIRWVDPLDLAAFCRKWNENSNNHWY